jgi:hypothetical protein
MNIHALSKIKIFIYCDARAESPIVEPEPDVRCSATFPLKLIAANVSLPSKKL